MSVTVTSSLDDPIVTFTFDALDPSTLHETATQVSQQLETLGTFYAVLDIRTVPMASGDAIQLLQKELPALFSDTRISAVFVSQEAESRDNFLLDTRGKSTVFPTQEAATDYVRIAISSQAPGRASNIDTHN